MKPISPPSITPFILKAIKPYPWQIAGLILVACYWAVHVSLQPYIIKLILNGVNESQQGGVKTFLVPLIIYVVIAYLFTLNFRFYDYVRLKLYPKLKATIVADATEIVSHHSYNFFQNNFAGALSDKIKNLSKGTAEILKLTIDRFFSHLLALIIAVGTLMTVHYILGCILLGWALFLLMLSLIFMKKVGKLSHEFSEAWSKVIGYNVDRFSNSLNIRLFHTFAYEKKLLNEKLEDTIMKDKKIDYMLIIMLSIQGFATATMISACILVMAFSANRQHITIGDFGLVFTLTLAIADTIWNLTKDITNFSEVYGMVSQGVALLNQDYDVKDEPHATELRVTSGEIRFQNVHFQYPNAEPLFSDKSITLYSGQKVGLVGYSGSGKSTFVNLILRLYNLSSGQILIDNQDISQVTQGSLHQSIAVIPQDPNLFHRSLMENIRYGRLEANDEQVIVASKKAHAHEFIERLVNGYDTLVGERGIKLSGGQRQRIAIARAILKNVKILILDEATSSLDSITENLIKNTLATLMQGKTTIVIAHRLSTLLDMDRILVFDQGKIIEDGTHQSLLDKNGAYTKLWQAQVNGFIPDQSDI